MDEATTDNATIDDEATTEEHGGDRVIKPHHHAFSIKQKMKMVKKAFEVKGRICATAKIYGIDPKMLCSWFKSIDRLKAKACINPRVRLATWEDQS